MILPLYQSDLSLSITLVLLNGHLFDAIYDRLQAMRMRLYEHAFVCESSFNSVALWLIN